MLTCLPEALCSPNYRLQGLPSGNDVFVKVNRTGDSGGFRIGDEEFEVRRHRQGLLGASWTLEQKGVVCAEVTKPKLLSAHYEIAAAGRQFGLRMEGVFSGGSKVMVGTDVVGTIKPVHAFTRRAVFDCQPSVPEHIQILCFWMVAMTRQQRANSSD